MRVKQAATRAIRPARTGVNRGILRAWFLSVTLSVALLQAGCLNRGPYVTFAQPNFRYEYPRGWAKQVESSPDFLHTQVWDPVVSDNESPVKVHVDVHLGLGARADQEAHDIVAGRINADSGEHNFVLVRQESIMLDGNDGYLAEFTDDTVSSYDVIPEKRFFIPSRTIDICSPRNGSVYEVWISASQNEWNAHEKDVQHVLNTFRWK